MQLNSNFADGFLLSIEMAVFVDGSRGYLLHLYDLTENIN